MTFHPLRSPWIPTPLLPSEALFLSPHPGRHIYLFFPSTRFSLLPVLPQPMLSSPNPDSSPASTYSSPNSLSSPSPFSAQIFAKIWVDLEGRNRGDYRSAQISQPLLPRASQTKLRAPQAASSSHPPPGTRLLLPFTWWKLAPPRLGRVSNRLSRAERRVGSPALRRREERAPSPSNEPRARRRQGRRRWPLAPRVPPRWGRPSPAFLPRATSPGAASDSEPKPRPRGLTSQRWRGRSQRASWTEASFILQFCPV